MSSEYKILKIPITKDKTVFYYYKRYVQKSAKPEQIVTLPQDRTIYVCHFLRAIEESFIQKFFGLAGKIKQINIGEYKNKANNKRKRRTVYFALVTYKNTEDCNHVLDEPKFLQAKVNLLTKKGIKFSENPFAKDNEEEEVEEQDDDHQEKMQDGGFTMVTAAALNENSHGVKGKGSDGISTVLGITQEEAKEIYDQQMRKLNHLDDDQQGDNEQQANEDDEDMGDGTGGMKYTTTKKRKAAMMNDFYKFQLKDYKKQKLEELRISFDEDRRRLAKMMSKQKEKEVKGKKTQE
ncbi:UNKNOWN [Stylonychia lemnae]|uniref:Ribosomal RNA-processing protein 7 C-terminal domain-containing protein n=1 Tax=Stylonychia lemnae TaxID=5949 RepID=A0A078AF88_STYLE|nr:UNKNOWN [Stylonychia lemnae]|eukprot:CDW80894.1 UNKNOWN [Stylonychia lemnae]